MPVNEFGQPVGDPVPDWTPPPMIGQVSLTGRTCEVEPLRAAHLGGLYEALVENSPPQTWTYLNAGPFEGRGGFADYLARLRSTEGTTPHVILDSGGRPQGIACYCRNVAETGCVEIGSLTYSTALRRTTAATEAMHLMADHAFGLGYRRYEWKCDSLNQASRDAAERLGFRYEGTFRRALTYKGRSRDTAWFAIIDADWPQVRAAQVAWLDPANFDPEGNARSHLFVAS